MNEMAEESYSPEAQDAAAASAYDQNQANIGATPIQIVPNTAAVHHHHAFHQASHMTPNCSLCHHVCLCPNMLHHHHHVPVPVAPPNVSLLPSTSFSRHPLFAPPPQHLTNDMGVGGGNNMDLQPTRRITRSSQQQQPILSDSANIGRQFVSPPVSTSSPIPTPNANNKRQLESDDFSVGSRSSEDETILGDLPPGMAMLAAAGGSSELRPDGLQIQGNEGRITRTRSKKALRLISPQPGSSESNINDNTINMTEQESSQHQPQPSAANSTSAHTSPDASYEQNERPIRKSINVHHNQTTNHDRLHMPIEQPRRSVSASPSLIPANNSSNNNHNGNGTHEQHLHQRRHQLVSPIRHVAPQATVTMGMQTTTQVLMQPIAVNVPIVQMQASGATSSNSAMGGLHQNMTANTGAGSSVSCPHAYCTCHTHHAPSGHACACMPCSVHTHNHGHCTAPCQLHSPCPQHCPMSALILGVNQQDVANQQMLAAANGMMLATMQQQQQTSVPLPMPLSVANQEYMQQQQHSQAQSQRAQPVQHRNTYSPQPWTQHMHRQTHNARPDSAQCGVYAAPSNQSQGPTNVSLSGRAVLMTSTTQHNQHYNNNTQGGGNRAANTRQPQQQQQQRVHSQQERLLVQRQAHSESARQAVQRWMRAPIGYQTTAPPPQPYPNVNASPLAQSATATMTAQAQAQQQAVTTMQAQQLQLQLQHQLQQQAAQQAHVQAQAQAHALSSQLVWPGTAPAQVPTTQVLPAQHQAELYGLVTPQLHSHSMITNLIAAFQYQHQDGLMRQYGQLAMPTAAQPAHAANTAQAAGMFYLPASASAQQQVSSQQQRLRQTQQQPNLAAFNASLQPPQVTHAGASMLFMTPGAPTLFAPAQHMQGYEMLTPYLVSQPTHIGLHTATEAFILQAPVSEPQPVGASRDTIEQCTKIELYEKMPQEEDTAESSEEIGERCTVCLCEFETSDRIRTLQCRHLYHVDCIDRWLVYNKKCPVCRLDLDKTDTPQTREPMAQHSVQR